MIKAYPITPENVERVRGIYEQFVPEAGNVYRWEHEPVGFEQLAQGLKHRLIHGYLVDDTARPDPVGLMLYRKEEHRAIEINLIYTKEPELKTITDRLMRLFIPDILKDPGWDVVSYPMLGEPQEALIRTILWYGFKPVGQAIQKFDLMDPVTVQILRQQQLDPLPEGYRLDRWQPQYAGAISQVVYETFKDAADAKWDPRFRTELGARRVVGMITQGVMGAHLAECTSVLLKDDVPVGFCFLIQSSMTAGNLPLIGVHPSEAGKGLGNHLLKQMLDQTIDNILAGKVGMLAVNATMDTDNIPAIKMYRRFGFREEYNYPHVYLTREKAESVKFGQWC